MKEHRTKALRVTTPHSIESSSGSSKDEFIGRENANDLFGTLQILQFEILPSSERPQYNGNATSSSSETGCTQSTSSARYTQSETMTMHTATFTANSVFGKHDSFYRWFSQNDEGRQIDEGSRGAGDDTTSCSDCNDNQDEQASETCHCRSSTFHNRKFRHKKSVSTDDRNLSLPLLHSEYSDSLLNIVSGDLCENWFLKIRDIKEVIRRAKAASQREDWYKSKDKYGNTALLVSGRKLLEEKQFDKAVELVKILLDEGADVNVINHENRTLLSYSISCMDDSIQLTTLLLNYGADVWSMDPIQKLPSHRIKKINSNYSGRRNCNNSAFTWFLRGVMRQLQFSDQCHRTFYVLAETMGENPTEMHRHVIATMLNHSQCYTIFGPVFYQIKQAMHPYWSQPRSLKYLCRSVIRNSIINVPGRFINEENVSSLKLPPSLQSYLMLEC